MDTYNEAGAFLGTDKTLDELELAAELEHFDLCQECGQAFDVRDLVMIYHHGSEGHEPIPTH